MYYYQTILEYLIVGYSQPTLSYCLIYLLLFFRQQQIQYGSDADQL